MIPSRPRPAGYPQWAACIASDHDRETFVFRRFAELSAVNLLFLQAEIMELERQLHELDDESTSCLDQDSIRATRQFEALLEQSEEKPSRYLPRRRMDLILKLRSSIKEYYEALLLESKISQLRPPCNRVLEALKQMFVQPVPMLEGRARDYLYQEDDLVALSTLPRQDVLSKYFRRAWAVEHRDEEKGNVTSLPRIGRFYERQIDKLVTILTIIIAAMFLVGPILALYFIPQDWAKLLVLGVFTSGFAASVALITNARRAEIFAGTATYAAVLVVFISQGGLSGSS